jgi:excisionase family DNA binding protein
VEKLPKKTLLRPDEVAKLWRISRSTVYRWADSGVIKAVRKGGVIRITREEAEKVICESG